MYDWKYIKYDSEMYSTYHEVLYTVHGTRTEYKMYTKLDLNRRSIFDIMYLPRMFCSSWISYIHVSVS